LTRARGACTVGVVTAFLLTLGIVAGSMGLACGGLWCYFQYRDWRDGYGRWRK
jgi:hypothetical protein